MIGAKMKCENRPKNQNTCPRIVPVTGRKIIAVRRDADNTMITMVESDNSGFNYANYNNPDYDALMDKAAAETDLDKRSKILFEAETIFMLWKKQSGGFLSTE